MSATQEHLGEHNKIETDSVNVQSEYPFSAPIRREDIESNVDGDAMEVEEIENDHNQPVVVRNDAIHLVGVDDLSTEEIRTYVRSYCGPKAFKVEWINDNSLNISYFRALDAEEAYHDLVVDSQGDGKIIDLLLAKPLAIGDKRADIMIRFAFSSDVKKKGARQNSRYYLINGEPSREDDLVRYGASVRPPTRIHQDMLDDDDLFSHRVQPKLGLAASDELASDLFPAKAALASSSSSGSGYRRDAADHDAENRDAFPSFPRGGRGGDSYGSRDRYDSERAKRNSRYEMSDRVDKWTKNSDLSVRISHGSRFPRGTNDDNDESRRKSNNQQQGRRNWRSRAGRSRSRSRSFSPDRRDDYMGKEERSFGSRLGGKRDDGNNRQSGGRSWDRRDRGRS